MPTVDLGKVGMSLKGVYDNEAQYEKLDVVYYDDSTYCAKVSTKGNTPSKEDDTYWQLLVAPNPLATWKPNTKEDEGYVQKGEGHEDSLWATDSEGNPKWTPKSDISTKVAVNSKTADGIVTKGQYNPDKVWATDGEGNPAWRDYNVEPIIVLDTSTWSESANYLYRVVAQVNILFDDSVNDYQKVFFSMFSSDWNPDIRTNLDFGAASYPTSDRYAMQFNAVSLNGVNTYENNFSMVFKEAKSANPGNFQFYIVLSRYFDANSKKRESKISIFNFQKTPGVVNVTWLWDYNIYIDPSRFSDRSYQYYGYTRQSAGVTALLRPVSKDAAGATPPPYSQTNMIFGTDSDANPKWLPADNWGFQTSAQVQEAISTAIASADFSSFEIVGSIPEPETAVENKFYLVKNEDTQHYDIYALLGEKVELIDDTTIDLTNYTTLTDEQYNALIQLLGEE